MFSVGLQSNYCGIDPYIVQLPLRNATPITVVKSLFTTGREDYRILTLQRAGRRKISVCHCPICHNFPMCGRYRLSRRKQTVEEHFDTALGRRRLEPPLQHRPHPARSGHPPESQGARSGIVVARIIREDIASAQSLERSGL
jgi:hypothetical protein